MFIEGGGLFTIYILNEYLIWYNEERIKSTLNYMSPLTYRKSLGLIA
ncbi:MAG: IS3 family transposase [Lachnospira sp.]|nr:IS3 family transposase [Lachnospira sp.]